MSMDLGLTGGLLPEPDYPQKCRHCAKPIRVHDGGTWQEWIDQDGWFRCMKDVNHLPMPRTTTGEP